MDMQRARRAQAAARRAESKELDLLLAAHDCSGSSAIADAARFAHGIEEARADVERMIEHMARVDDATRARCVRDYLERSEAPMRVCAACGARDPFDLCQKSVPLLELPDAHWLRADGGALARLHAAPDLQLLRLRPDGTYATEAVRRVELYNLTVVQGEAFHAVPEAVDAEGNCRLCRRCAWGWDENQPAQRFEAWACGAATGVCARLPTRTRVSSARCARTTLSRCGTCIRAPVTWLVLSIVLRW